MQAAGERLLAAGDWRDAAEKGWLAARNASQALLLEVNGEEQPRTPNLSAGIRALAHQRGGKWQELNVHLAQAAYYLHSEAFLWRRLCGRHSRPGARHSLLHCPGRGTGRVDEGGKRAGLCPWTWGKPCCKWIRRPGSGGRGYEIRQERLARLLQAAAAIPPELARERTRNFVDPFLAAEVQTDLLGATDAPPPPADWAAASVDGSHIDVDRHLPVACYLLNLGGCVLTYGRQAAAQFFSQPQLAYRPEELYLRDPEHPAAEEAVAGPLLGLRRMVRELERLAAVVAEIPPDLPVLALVDGTLVLWGLAGQGYPPFVRDALVQEGLLPALDSLRELAAAGRPLTLAAYVSLPRVTEVVKRYPPLPLPGGIEPLPGILRSPGSPL